jgi:hypothetical protein
VRSNWRGRRATAIRPTNRRDHHSGVPTALAKHPDVEVTIRRLTLGKVLGTVTFATASRY